jgi:hypothetical protein
MHLFSEIEDGGLRFAFAPEMRTQYSVEWFALSPLLCERVLVAYVLIAE